MEQTAMQANPLYEKESIVDAEVDAIYRVLKGKIQLDNLIPTCIEVAKEIESMSKRKGKDKLELLQRILRQALQDSAKPAEEKTRILFVVDTVVPLVVQAAILASKSPIVAQVHTACVGCCWTKTT